ncbi:MAG: hypothetical protein COB81_07240 [Flavobacteriaceae bacterium]|nr:MAG: hypothetical protein COB81_07240 [Flavobacteriaceae bacterium]
MKQENALQLLQTVQLENAYVKVVEQLNKDMYMAALDIEFPTDLSPASLVKNLEVQLEILLLKQYDDYLNLMYRVDVQEADLLKLKGLFADALITEIAFLILKREWQKVYFRSKF